MKNKISLFLIAFLTSCASSVAIETVQYRRDSKNGQSNKEKKLLDIPKKYKLQTFVGGHGEKEQVYTFSDSVKVYVTDLPVSMLNYNNILSLGDSVANKRFEGTELKAAVAKALGQSYVLETLILQGKTSNGLYWKDIRMGDVSIGYVNVPLSKKEQFDSVLSSFR